MKKRLFLLILLIIFATSLVISLLIGRFSYNFVKTVLRENREEKLFRIEKQLDHYQSILNSIEKNMEKEGQSALLNLAVNYPSPDSVKKTSSEQLRKKAKELNVGHIYFIDSAGMVFNSSLSPDVGLNLLTISNSFTKYINSIYGKGEIFSQGITVSTREGKVYHYMYYSPKGSSMIYEVSFDVLDFVNKKYNFALYEFLFGDMFKNFYNEYLHSIDIYSITKGSGWSLINEGKRITLQPDMISRIIQEDSVVIESGDKIYVYKKMRMNRYFFNRTTNVYFELIYDTSSLKKYTNRIILYSVLSIITIIIIAFIISAASLNSLLIKRIMNIIDGLKRIQDGDYNTVIIDDRKDEVTDIAANINHLAETVKHRTDELNATNDELRELSLYINDIIESMPSIIITLDDSERIIHWNSEAEKFTGYTSDEAVGRILWDFIPEFSKYRNKCDEVRKNRNTVEIHKEVFVKDGFGVEESFVKNIFIFPFSKKDITGTIIRVDDITELEKNEERLNRASKVESLGTMAGGLAHDFNNIITGIISTASYLDMIIRDSGINVDEVSSHLDVIKKSGGKAALLVKNLMSVSRDERDNFEIINFEHIVKDVTGIARPSVPVNIGLTFFSSMPECPISGNRSQLEQVILNLIVNASEAILRCKTEKPCISLLLDKAEDSRMLSGFENGAWHLSVADNGPGISRTNLKKIFDPFFTTKSEGSGLGLAVVYNIIIRHGGFIEVHSEPDSGTVFDIYLPAV